MPIKGGLNFALGSKGGQVVKPVLAATPAAPTGGKRRLAAFSADSDDEGDVPHAKRQHAAPIPETGEPRDSEVHKVAIKLAEFVARNGRQLEEVTRQRNPGDGPFRFLFDTASPTYKWYDAQVAKFQAGAPGGQIPPPSVKAEPSVAGSAGWEAAQLAAAPPPPPPEASLPHPDAAASPPLPPSEAVAAAGGDRRAAEAIAAAQAIAARLSGAAAGPSPASSRHLREPPSAGRSTAASAAAPAAQLLQQPVPAAVVAAAPRGVDALAAMERFAAEAAARESSKRAAEAEEERRVELLNENAYDRRAVKAVYKQDGKRGHHMQDFIPPEELSKLLSKSKSAAAQAAAEQLEAQQKIQADNIGHRLLSKMGWKEGSGLGANSGGVAAPVAASGASQEKRGLGAQEHGAIEEGDDEFEQYRKRMMLGYRHRPNPLGNPRKSYY